MAPSRLRRARLDFLVGNECNAAGRGVVTDTASAGGVRIEIREVCIGGGDRVDARGSDWVGSALCWRRAWLGQARGPVRGGGGSRKTFCFKFLFVGDIC